MTSDNRTQVNSLDLGVVSLTERIFKEESLDR